MLFICLPANVLSLGPFRRTCEITLGLLRQNEDALMTILETFLHDPTTDFIGKRVSPVYLTKGERMRMNFLLIFAASHSCQRPRYAGRRLGGGSE